MPDTEPEIAHCYACGEAMDISELAPFTRVVCPACQEHNRVKSEFGPYQLSRRYAIGGMSMVFVAQDTTLDREAVVKILNEDYSADEKRIAAFEEEARITASFSHPNVVRVFTTGRAFGRFFIAMEFVTGGHFEHHIRENGVIPEAEALPLAIEVAEGLRAAHAAGLIHRDVKPGNILIDGTGHAKIVDFGLALVTKGGTAQAEEIWATPYYVPPETIEGLPEDFRSDVYAFGATFYHAMAGKPPCDEETMNTDRLREAKGLVKPLGEVAPRLSHATCEVIDRAMAYNPADRHASYDELIADLQAAQTLLLGGQSEEAGAAAEATRRESGQRAREKAGLIAAVVLVLAAAGFSFWWLSRDETGGEQVETDPPVTVEPLEVAKPVPGKTTGLRLATRYREAGEALMGRDFAEAREGFAEVRDDPEVMEPTGSWAACEAVMAALLDGRGHDARKEAAAGLEHLSGAAGLDPGVADSLKTALQGIRGFKPFTLDQVEGAGNAGTLIAMMGGLKNWEQGMMGQAEPLFRQVVEASGDGSAWLAPYAALADDYLSDFGKLKAAEPEEFELEEEESLALVDELHALHSSLKTRGRARFNVRSWQLELAKGMRRKKEAEEKSEELSEEKSEPDPPLAAVSDPREKLEMAWKECRFGAAVRQLKQWRPQKPGQRQTRRTLVLLSEAAGAFLSDLEDRLKGGAKLGVECRDGRTFPAIVGTAPGQILVRDEDGAESSLKWSEISPDALIQFHQASIREESSEVEKRRRHHQAVAFGLLAGDRERAAAAGARLAERDAEFQAEWDRIQAALEL